MDLMQWIAVHGPAYSGKTTFARRAEAEGFRWLNYTDKLKEMFALEMQRRGLPLTVDMVRADKGFWRPFLQLYGTMVGYDRGAFVEDMLSELGEYPRAVFDNVRFPAQYDKLAPRGFVLVRFTVSPAVQAERAMAAGVPFAKLTEALSHEAEKPLPRYPHEIEVDGDKPIDEVYAAIMARVRIGQAA